MFNIIVVDNIVPYHLESCAFGVMSNMNVCLMLSIVLSLILGSCALNSDLYEQLKVSEADRCAFAFVSSKLWFSKVH